MVTADSPETLALLERVRRGEATAFEDLFKRHRPRLRNAIALRMDRRLSPRVDASDILQETYLEAVERLSRYLQSPAMPFFLWLRWIAREKVLEAHRRHLGARKRAIDREVPLLPGDTSAQLAATLVGQETTPSQALARAELVERLQKAFEQLGQDERELILWRHFEQLTAREAAELLHTTEAAASKRYIRALERLRNLLVQMGIPGPG